MNNQNQKASILTVGSLAFDSIQTPAGRATSVLGGSCNYFSVAASFYTPVQIIGVVGKDFPKSHLEWLQSRNVDTSGVEIADGKTFHWKGEYGADLNEAKTLQTDLNVFEHFNPRLTPKQAEASYIFLANIDPVLQTSILDQNKSHKLVACDSMNLWINIKLEELKNTLKRVDILSINEGEARLLSKQANLVQAAHRIREMGPSVVIIKRGEYGACLFSDQLTFLASAYPCPEVVDPTGAGDTFAGGFMGHLVQEGADREMASRDPKRWNKILRDAVVSGCVLASFTVEDFSLNRLIRLEKSEIEKRRLEFLSMTQIHA